MLDAITGWLGPAEAQLLHDLAADVRLPQMIVEVGSYQGKSTVALALSAQTPVFSVDPHEPSVGDSFQFGDQDRAALMANLVQAGVAWKVRLWDVQSQYAARGWPGHQIGLLYIDGAHSYEGVKADLDAWLPYVVDGGYVAFHDSNAEQIQWAIAERPDLAYEQTADVTAVYRKAQPAEPEPEPETLGYGYPIEDAPEPERVARTLRKTAKKKVTRRR